MVTAEDVKKMKVQVRALGQQHLWRLQ